MPCRHTLITILVLASALWAASAPAGTPPHEAAYQQARRAYYNFKADKDKQKFRHNWQNVARKFERVAEKYPESPRAPDALFTAGKLYHDLYLISRVDEDLDKATEMFQGLVDRFPENHLSDDAQMYIVMKWVEFKKNSSRARKALAYLVDRFPEGDATPKARRMLEDLGGPPEPKAPEKKPGTEPPGQAEKKTTTAVAAPGPPVLENIRHWSNPGYTRISLYTRVKTRYRTGKLEADAKSGKPARLYVDLVDTHVEGDLAGPVEVRDSVVRRIRFAERKKGFVRVVVELNGDMPHRVFPLDDPARVVLDITADEDTVASVIGEKLPAGDNQGKKRKKQQKKKRRTKRTAKKKIRELKTKSQPGASLSMLAGLKIKCVVIDPGHGGKDPGAIGPSGTLEKDVVLDVARRLRTLLKDKLGLEVLLTRNRDRFMALEARTAFANKRNADLFVSIHVNAHRNRKYRGVETFYLDLTNDRYSIKLAARENATSEKSISDLKYILADLALKSHVDDSISLSRMVQKGMVGTLRRGYKSVRDMGLKPALFYVLIGARMPSILVEGSFLTNPMEEKRLRTKSYRQKLAEGIYVGIKNFIDERAKLYDPDRL